MVEDALDGERPNEVLIGRARPLPASTPVLSRSKDAPRLVPAVWSRGRCLRLVSGADIILPLRLGTPSRLGLGGGTRDRVDWDMPISLAWFSINGSTERAAVRSDGS